MSSRTAVDSEGSWFEPEQVTELRRRLPIPYVDIVPVRTDVHGAVEEVGLLLRASGAGQIVRAIASGRVLVHETIREAIARLETAGLVQTMPGRSTVVSSIDRKSALDAQAVAKGVSVIPDCGLAPGMVNILAAEGIRRLDL